MLRIVAVVNDLNQAVIVLAWAAAFQDEICSECTGWGLVAGRCSASQNFTHRLQGDIDCPAVAGIGTLHAGDLGPPIPIAHPSPQVSTRVGALLGGRSLRQAIDIAS